MRKLLLICMTCVGLAGAGLATQAHAAHEIVGPPSLIEETNVLPIHYDEWREREWRRHERWLEWHRHEEWRRWHHYHGY